MNGSGCGATGTWKRKKDALLVEARNANTSAYILVGHFLTIFSRSWPLTARLQCMKALFPPPCFLVWQITLLSPISYSNDSSTEFNCLLGKAKKVAF